jgi:hypothetical protein
MRILPEGVVNVRNNRCVRNGRQLTLATLDGRQAERIPIGLFTWGFDYLWKPAGIEPWYLALGSSETWHRAHMALLERHRPDVLMYSGAGKGSAEPKLLGETSDAWIVLENNTGMKYGVDKGSYTRYRADAGNNSKDTDCKIHSFEDADRLLPHTNLSDDVYLSGLARLIRDVGCRALVIPHTSPAYICACYSFGFEDAMTTMLDHPKLFDYVCEKLRRDERDYMLQLSAAGAEAVFIADSWASCDIISPAMFRRFALPYQETMVQAARDAGLRPILWNGGDILPILEEEASLNIDAFAFEQPRKRMRISVRDVRTIFGERRCIFGNLDSELLLMRNDPEEIESAVEEQIRQSGVGAPFILFTGSPIPSNISLDAVDTMMDAARRLTHQEGFK